MGIGLTEKERIIVRARGVNALYLAYHHAPSVHYTEGDRRWSGIDDHRRSYKGQYPYYADCSAFATWAIWDSLKAWINEGLRDCVNGENWKSGYTGTMLNHGKSVSRPGFGLDCVIYGTPGSTGAHTAVGIGDGHRVISHGSEGGPYLLDWKYRTDVMDVRRFIL